jgi:hypothetical protein
MHTRHFVDILFNLGLFPLINKPSRTTESTITLIDNIFSNDLALIYSSGLLINDISDHLPIFLFSKHAKRNKDYHHYKMIRRINDNNIQLMKNELSEQNWNLVCNCNNVNLAYDNFLDIFMKVYNKHCPLQKVYVKQKSIERPWFNNSLKNACKKKNILYKKFLKTRSTKQIPDTNYTKIN